MPAFVRHMTEDRLAWWPWKAGFYFKGRVDVTETATRLAARDRHGTSDARFIASVPQAEGGNHARHAREVSDGLRALHAPGRVGPAALQSLVWRAFTQQLSRNSSRSPRLEGPGACVLRIHGSLLARARFERKSDLSAVASAYAWSVIIGKGNGRSQPDMQRHWANPRPLRDSL